MTILGLSGLINFLTSLTIAIIVIAKNFKNKSSVSFFCLNFCVGFFSFFYFIWQFSRSASEAVLPFKLIMVGIIFINFTFIHFVFSLVGSVKRKKQELIALFIITLLLAIMALNSKFFLGFEEKYGAGYWPLPTKLFSVYLISWFIQCAYGVFYLIKGFNSSVGLKRQQIKYFLFAAVIGFLGGASNWPLWYGVKIIPYANFLISLYLIIVAFAIIKYHLIDIKIVISRAGIFLFVYTLVLGLPLYLGFKHGLWQHSTWVSIVLATAGPFLYLFLQKKAEERIFQEELRTQELLLQVSYGMNAIHQLDRLVDLIVDAVVDILRVNRADIFLLDKEAFVYCRKETLEGDGTTTMIETPCAMLEYAKQKKFPLVYEEINMLKSSEDDGFNYALIAQQMDDIHARIIVPMIINGSLLGFLALGDRSSKEIFSKDLLNALTVLGNQAALVIENCHYLEAETKRMQDEGLRERMESLDNMASSMAHEIDNPMHGVRTSLAFIKDFIMPDPRFDVPEPLRGDMSDAIRRIENCGERVSSMIKAILDYSRLGTGQLMPIRIADAVEGFLELITPQIKKDKVDFQVEVSEKLPFIFGDRIQLEEILMNFVRNSLHAVKLESHKKITLKIFEKNTDTVRIECTDNGYGIKTEILKDIFLSSMTTKGSSEGTGLGLYRIRKIVDLFKGNVWAESPGKGKGSTFIVELPSCKGNMEDLLKGDISLGQ